MEATFLQDCKHLLVFDMENMAIKAAKPSVWSCSRPSAHRVALKSAI